jgi:hypothetical protein
MPWVLGESYGVGRFLMSEVPLYPGAGISRPRFVQAGTRRDAGLLEGYRSFSDGAHDGRASA